MKFSLKKILIICIVIFFYICVYYKWIFNFGIITSGDWSFFGINELASLRINYFSLWLSDYSLGRVLSDIGQAPTYALYGYFYNLFHFDYSISERIIHLLPTIIVAPISSYFLGKNILKDKYAAILSSIIYSFNTYFLTLQTGHLTLAAAYAIAPLSILLYIRYLKNPTYLNFFLCSLVFFIHSAYEPRSFLIACGILLCIAILHIYSKKGDNKIYKLILIASAPIISFVLLNIYWIIGLVAVGSNVGTNIIASNLFGDQYYDILKSITIFHPFWSGGLIVSFVNNAVPIYMYIIPALLIAGAYFGRKDKKIIALTILALIGIILAKQSAQPFPELYNWLFNHFPGFKAFRESSKFYLILALSYSLIIPMAYIGIKRKFKNRYANFIVFTSISFLFLINVIPLVTSNIGNTFVYKHIPTEYLKLNNFLNQDAFSRTLWLPIRSRWGLASQNHPYIDANTITSTNWKSYIDPALTTPSPSTSEKVLTAFNSSYSNQLFRSASIKYVVIPLPDDISTDNIYGVTASDQKTYLTALRKVKWLKEVKLNIKGIYVFENENFVPYVDTYSKLYGIDTIQKLPAIHNLLSSTTINDPGFNFVVNNNESYVSQYKNLENLSKSSGKYSLYFKDPSYFSYTYNNGHLEIFKNSGNFEDFKKISSSTNLIYKDDTKTDLYLNNGNETYPIGSTKEVNYISNSTARVLATTGNNLALSLRKWSGLPGCSLNRDIFFSYDYEEQKNTLSMSPSDKILCFGYQSDKFESGKYIFSIRYKVQSGQLASLELVANKDNIEFKDIPIGDGNWHTYYSIVDLKSNAKIDVKLIAKPSDQINQATKIYYQDPTIKKVSNDIKFDNNNDYQKSLVTESRNKIDAPASNLIPNGNLKLGLWEKTVNDCNRYDNYPDIGMTLDSNISGEKILHLRAKRHIACTDSPDITLKPQRKYMLSFDFKSPNSTYSVVRISFKNSNASAVTKVFSITDNKWNKSSLEFTAPPDVTATYVTVLSYPDYTESADYDNYYKNFSVSEIDEKNTDNVGVQSNDDNYTIPRNTQIIKRSNVEKEIKINSASTSFYLNISEAYHPKWSMYIVNDSGKSELVKSHYAANQLVNGWFIDLNACKKVDLCKKNADGSYDLIVKISYTPNTVLKYGMIFSSAFFMLLLAIAVINLRRIYDKTK